jgi:hypothetical protein
MKKKTEDKKPSDTVRLSCFLSFRQAGETSAKYIF